MHPPESKLIYDWNRAGGAVSPARGKVELDDETLRDEVVAASPASGVNTGVPRFRGYFLTWERRSTRCRGATRPTGRSFGGGWCSWFARGGGRRSWRGSLRRRRRRSATGCARPTWMRGVAATE